MSATLGKIIRSPAFCSTLFLAAVAAIGYLLVTKFMKEKFAGMQRAAIHKALIAAKRENFSPATVGGQPDDSTTAAESFGPVGNAARAAAKRVAKL